MLWCFWKGCCGSVCAGDVGIKWLWCCGASGKVVVGVLVLVMEKEPDIMGLVETKLSEEMTTPKIGGGKYGIWKRNRTGKREVE